MSNQKPNLPDDVERALRAYLDAPTWSDKKRILEANKGLLLTDFQRAFELSAWIVNSPEATPLSPMMGEQQVLLDSLKNGIDIAFSERRNGLSRYFPLGDELWRQFQIEDLDSAEPFAQAIYREHRSSDQLIHVEGQVWEPLVLNIPDSPVFLAAYPTFFALYLQNVMQNFLLIPWVQIEGVDLAPSGIPGKVVEETVLFRFREWIEQDSLHFFFLLDAKDAIDAQYVIYSVTSRRRAFMQGLHK